MKKILIHLHLFYKDQIDYFIEKINNLRPYSFDLFVSTTEDNLKDTILINKIRSNFPEAHIYPVPNLGWDVGPFVDLINKTDLDNYSYVIKLQSKRIKNCYFKNKDTHTCIFNQNWRNAMVDAILGSPDIVAKNLNVFQNDKNVGEIASYYVVMNHKIDKLDKMIGIKKYVDDKTASITTAVGTMFMIRADLLKKLQGYKFKITDFSKSDKNVHNGTLAHICEWLFGYITESQGYKIVSLDKNLRSDFLSFLRQIRNMFYKVSENRNGSKTVRIFKISLLKIKNN